ncbi:anaerobic C4-dicarboxylate transporter [Myroides sp. 1354]|uniref:anaerobic C4-dicarboxylate transporter family protein n=1 Tax=unclassified Myroides TaxID=2642485 RepID=UPI0025757C94|nr:MULTISPECIES: anaerobic C4-dicarboxylate transporter [unclassified Myroides]MDM1045447.1 anaerobic C4-dicarboxylate transporter [Myroides sp. R163-1]MDM1056449.1 anaerobic C4-dicarboxylate transporter [Myroides sp. 1354]MDM1069681.1 anaerobic C4-dicarboxylate transporter [Myroides sp. 1372]
MLLIQFAILIAMILIGSQMKGIGLGVMGMVGLLIFVFIFQMKPGDPPIDVMLVIMAIVSTAATLQACGGLDYLVRLAERVIRSNPSNIVFIAPFTVYFFCLFAGTAHLLYSLLPIIAEVATKKRIRPERPLSVSVIASHLAITGSPMSAATAAFAGASILAYPGALIDIMKICIPACLIGILITCLVVLKKGKELNEDPIFLEKMKDPEFAKSLDADEDASGNKKPLKKGAKTSVVIFAIAVLLIVIAGAFPHILPQFEPGEASLVVKANGELQMVSVISMITLTASALMMLITKTSAISVTKVSLFSSMATAVVSVFGVVWMSATFMSHNEVVIKGFLSDIVTLYPWTFAIAVFILGALMFSQAATTKTMMPLGMALGVSNPALIAIFPAVNADFVLPGYPTLLAAINFDRTGSTKIGKFVVNHSFMIPGLVAIVVAIAAGFLLGSFLL